MPDESFSELSGQRVVLRRFQLEDVGTFVAYRSRLRESTWATGEWTDDLLYALLHGEWQTGRQ